MNFLENILQRLQKTPERVVLEELRPEGGRTATAAELLAKIGAARGFLVAAGLSKGDRCALLAPNGIDWVAVDLAAMSAGIIVVPLYTRQAPAELAVMLRDCQAKLIICGDGPLLEAIGEAWTRGRGVLIGTVVSTVTGGESELTVSLADNDPVTIIYTSGTSGEPKGVMLAVANVTHMLSCTTERLDTLMGARSQPDQVFHYLPFCFAGSWILLLSCLSRSGVLRLSTDLTRLADDLRAVQPDYCLNVPQLLERIRAAVEGQLSSRGGFTFKVFQKAREAWLKRQNGNGSSGGVWLKLGQALIFPTIRRKLGPNLKALICGSAPLALETQRFFMMLGIPVLQVYGLTETTAICTMDDPRGVEPGTVGPAISGVEMKLGTGGEILVRGPNMFLGYWNRAEATAKVMEDGWFHTGDQGEQTQAGNWRIIGRLKNLLILSSGHNIAPEPLEETLTRALAGAQQVVLFGHGRSYLTALVTGDVRRERAEAEVARLNATLPHYRQIRALHFEEQTLTIESGLLTANGKLRRDAIAEHFNDAIENMYSRKSNE